nr:unnamed protein product [Callosobruchus chinensis]
MDNIQHEKAGKGAFLFKAAIRGAEELSLTIDFTWRCQQSITELAPAQLKTHIKAAEVEFLLNLHKDKPMHGIFYKHLEEHGLSQQLTFSFLRSSGLKSETEGFIMACQDRRHGLHETPVLPYAPGDIESVVENERCRIYWNYSFPTLELVQANKPDIVLLDHQQKTMFITDCATSSLLVESGESDSSDDENAENPSNGKILKVLNYRFDELEKAITFNGDMMEKLQKTIEAITEENKKLKKEQDQLKTRVTDLVKEANVVKNLLFFKKRE